MMSRLKVVATAATLASLAAILIAAHPGIRAATPATAQGLDLSLDADVSNGGPCATIDPSVTVAPGDAFQVAACIRGLPAPLGVFKFDVVYDDTLISAPEIPLMNAGLDDNPDANAGTTVWGDSLGEGWTCDIMDLGQQPAGDSDPESGPNRGVAQIACWTITGTTTLGDNEDAGVLAVISFVAGPNPGGPVTLVVTGGETGNSGGVGMGMCNPGGDPALTCNGASIEIAGAAVPTEQVPTPTPFSGQIERYVPGSGEQLLGLVDTPSAVSPGETPATAGTPMPTAIGGAGETPGATGDDGSTDGDSADAEDGNSEEDDGGNGWVLPVIIGAIAGVAVLGGASAFYVRRRRA